MSTRFWRCNFQFGAPRQPPAPLICKLIKRQMSSLRHIGPKKGLFINPHNKQSVLYLLGWIRRFCGCSEIKIASPEAWRPMAGRTDGRRAARSEIRMRMPRTHHFGGFFLSSTTTTTAETAIPIISTTSAVRSLSSD